MLPLSFSFVLEVWKPRFQAAWQCYQDPPLFSPAPIPHPYFWPPLVQLLEEWKPRFQAARQCYRDRKRKLELLSMAVLPMEPGLCARGEGGLLIGSIGLCLSSSEVIRPWSKGGKGGEGSGRRWGLRGSGPPAPIGTATSAVTGSIDLCPPPPRPRDWIYRSVPPSVR